MNRSFVLAILALCSGTFALRAQPTISANGLSPSSVAPGSPSFLLTINGSNFNNGTAYWSTTGGTTALTVNSVNATQVIATVPAALVAAPGTVLVTYQDGSGISNAAQFIIQSAPVVTSINPVAATAGGPALQIVANGSNFLSNSVVVWNPGGGPQTLVTTFVNSTQLSAVVPAGLTATAGSALVNVQTPGGAASNLVTFTINAAPSVPTIASGGLSPSTTPAGSPAFQMIVTGTNFVNGSIVQFNSGNGPQSLATTYLSPTQLASVVPAALVTTAGNSFVSVLNPGGASSNLSVFAVSAAPAAAAPTIGAGGLNPASATAGSGAVQITVTGTNFLSTSVVQWNSGAGPQSLPTSLVSGTQLTALVPAALLATAGPVFVTVQNPGGLNSNLAVFTVSAPASTTASIAAGGLSPSSATAGGGSFQLGVTGTNFINGAVVLWNSGSGAVPLTTGFGSSSQLTAVVPASLVATAGSAFVTVQNPGGTASNAVTFTINAAPAPAQPSAALLTPATATAGSAATQITVTGTNFTGSSIVEWNTGSTLQALSTVFVSATQLSALVPAGLLATAGTAFVSVQNTGGQASNLLTFTITAAPAPVAPTAASLTPSSVVAGGTSFTLGVTGTNFVSGSVVLWNAGSGSQSLATVYVSATQVTALVPASSIATAGTTLVGVQNPGGATSNLVQFTVTAAPVPGQPGIGAGGLSPASVTAGSGVTQINVTGSNFVNGSIVEWNTGGGPVALSTVFVSATQLSAVIPASLLTAAGTSLVYVQNPGQGGSASNFAPFTINAAAAPVQPTISANGLTPATVTSGSSSFTLTVTGTNFVAGSVVQWNSGSGTQSLATQPSSSTSLTALVPASLLATAGPVFVTVQNPGGATSNIANFTIAAPVSALPAISANGVAPASATAGSAATQIVVTGTNFVSGSVVYWTAGSTPVALYTVFVNATQLTAVVPASLLATAGSSLINVQNPGGAGSNLVGFTVTSVVTPAPVQPSISASGGLTPASATAGSAALQLVVTGTNFVTGSVVQWNTGSGAQPLSSVFVSATQLAAVVPASLLATAGSAFVTVQNPGGLSSSFATFTVNAAAALAAPTIATGGLSPASATVGSAAFQLSITGTNFVGGSVVQWNSGAGAQSLATVLLTPTQLTALVPAALLTAVGPVFVTVQNPGGLSSNLSIFNVTAVVPSIPTISAGGLSPATVAVGSGAIQIGVTGTNFVNGAVVLWNSGSGNVPLTTAFVSATALTATVPASLLTSANTAFVSVQNAGGATSNAIAFPVTAVPAPAQPTISALTPATVVAGSPAMQVTVTGTNFIGGSVVQWNTGAAVQALPTIFVNSTQLAALIPAGLVANAGTAFVNVLNGAGQSSNLLTFTVTAAPAAPAPFVSGISPASTAAGGTSFTLGVTGANFVTGSAVLWNTGSGAQTLATVYVSATQLTALVPASLIAAAGTTLVGVQNPGGTASNLLAFTITATAPAAQPAIGPSGLSPSSATAGSGVTQVSITGSNFVSGSLVQWNAGAGPQTLSTVFVNANQLSAVIPPTLLATAGTALLNVVNPGGSASNLVTFTITAPAAAPQPTISLSNGLSPASGTVGGTSFTLSVTGTNFVTGSVVQFNSGTGTQALFTQVLSSTVLTALVPTSLLSAAGPLFVTVQNPGGATSNIIIFQVNAAPFLQPTITVTNGVTPASATAGSQAVQILVTGTNFVSGSVVLWNAGATPQALYTVYVNATQLSAVVPATLLSAVGSAFVSVQNPGGGTSNLVPFVINSATAPAALQPTILSPGGLNPSSATAGSGAFQLLVNGTTFVPGSVVQWNSGAGPQTLSTVYVNTTQLAAVVPANLLTTAGTAFLSVQNPGGLASSFATFTINPAPAPASPAIGSGGLSPSTANAGSPSLQLTVTGSNFVSGSVVQWNSGAGAQSLATVLLSPTQLTALVPAALLATAGPVFVSVQNPGGVSSNLASFTVNTTPPPPSPVISTGGLSPATAVSGAGSFQLGVTGSNFVTGSVVLWNSGGVSQPISTTLISSTQLTALVPASLSATVGTAFVTVQNPGSLNSNTESFTVTAAPPPAQPTAAAVTPNTAVAGSTALQVSITGTNFVSGSVVQWNTGASAQTLTTVYVSPTQLSALVPTGFLANAGNAFLNVQNPSGTSSNLLTFTLTAPTPPPAPSINTNGGLTPSTATAGGPAFTLGVTGANFVTGAVVQINNGLTVQSLPTVFVSSTQLTALVPASAIATAGTAFIGVQNTGGATATPVSFTIAAAPPPAQPTISSLTPSSMVAGGSVVQMVVTGTNFLPASVVQFSGGTGTKSLTTVYVNSNQLTALVTGDLLATPGTAFVSVTNPGAPGSNLSTFLISSVATAPAPTIASGGLSPASVGVGSTAVDITINGTGFTKTSKVRFTTGTANQLLNTAYINTTQLTAIVPAGLLTAADQAFVDVENPDGSASNIATFVISTVVAIQPSLNSTAGLTPNTAVAGSPALTITLMGTNFLSSSVVQWNVGQNPQSLFTVYVSPTQLSAVIPATLLATAGTFPVGVQNPGNANAVPTDFVVTAAPAATLPVITDPGGLSPSSVSQAGNSFSLTVTGSGFTSGSVVQWSTGGTPQALVTTFVNSNLVRAVVPSNLIASAGTAFVNVNVPVAGSSNQVIFTINPPNSPSINPNGLSPGVATVGSPSLLLTINGTNFVPGSVVQWNSGTSPTTLSTSFLSSTQLTALVPANLLLTPGSAFVGVVNPGGFSSSLAVFTINSVSGPSISTANGLTPSTAATGTTGLTLQVSGTNFVTGSVVQWNAGGSAAVPLATGYVNSTQLTALVPSTLLVNPGTVLVSVVNPDKSISNASNFTVTGPQLGATPTVASTSPSSASAGTSSLLLMTVTGSNFVSSSTGSSGSTVLWNGAPQPTTYVSPTQLTALVDSSLLQVPGSAFVTVVNPGNVSSGGVKFQVNGPTLGAVVPASIVAGGPGFNISLSGTNLVSGSVVVWNGINLNTTYGGPTQVTAQVPANLIATPGTAFVLITNPGGASSSPLVFTVTVPAASSISSLTPASAVAGGAAFQLVIQGTGFVQGSVVMWNGAQVASAYTSGTQISALIDASLTSAAGIANITVQNPGSAPSAAIRFTISGPTISSVSPVSANAGDPSFNLTVNGSNFVSGATVFWNATALPTSFVGGQVPQLIAIVGPGLLKTPTLVSITVMNPGGATSPAQSFSVNSPSLRILTTSLPDAVVGSFYSQALAASGGDQPYTWSVSSGTLPNGFSLDANGGVISGTAAGPISSVLGITLTDASGRTTTTSISLRASLALTITTLSPLPLATAGSLYSTTFQATGGTPPYLWSAPATCGSDNAGNCLPAGLSVNVSTGELTGIPQVPGPFHFTISARDSRQQQFANKAFDLAVSISTLTISGFSPTVAPAQQLPVQISTGIPYPIDLSGTLTVVFVSAVGGDDASIVFSNGARTVRFTIPAGTTEAVYGANSQILLSTGTVAGTITVKATLQAGVTDLTPNPAPLLTATVAKLAPVLTSVKVTKITGGVQVAIAGYTTTKEATQATLVFNAATGASLKAAPINVALAATLSAYYQSAAAAGFGSQFLVTIPLSVQGDLSAIGSVTVTVTNTIGTSAAVTATVQ